MEGKKIENRPLLSSSSKGGPLENGGIKEYTNRPTSLPTSPTLSTADSDVVEVINEDGHRNDKKIGSVGLAMLAFFITCAGPFGIEPAVQAGGPAICLASLIVIPFVFALPQGLVTAELSTMLSENGGTVNWVIEALGEPLGWANGFAVAAKQVMDIPVYLVLSADYVDAWVRGAYPGQGGDCGGGDGCAGVGPGEGGSAGLPSWGRLLIMATGLVLGTAANLRGLQTVERVSVALLVAVLTPFFLVFVFVLARGEVDPGAWGAVSKRCTLEGVDSYDACLAAGGSLETHVDYTTLISVLLWAWMGWDSLGAVAGEVRNPRRSFPIGMLLATCLSFFTYALPIIAALAVSTDFGIWADGFFVTASRRVSKFLGGWVLGAVVLGNFGQFNSCLSTDARALWAMAGGSEANRADPLVPRFLSWEWARYKTPAMSILFHAATTIILMNLDFTFLVNLNVFLNNVTLILLGAAFVEFRRRHPDKERPFKVPGGWFGVVAVCLPLAAVIIISFATSSWVVLASGFGFMAIVMFAYYAKIAWQRNRAKSDRAPPHQLPP